ncbi:MAG: SDR family NAD(P)-dependent oxidoreductase [Steroidobacteraceae bacterium]
MRNIIVTGGSRGLGLAIASTLAVGGNRVIAVARSATSELAAAADALEQSLALEPSQKGALLFRSCDLADLARIRDFVGALRQEFGTLYGLVNNAGLGTHGMLSMMRDEEIERLVRLNTIVPMMLAKYVLRSMMVAKAGRIVNVASIVAATGYAGLAAYAATKASLIGFTRSLAREVGPLGITVNAVAPGFVDTEMTRELGEAERERIRRRSALKRLARPEDIASAVEFLLSDRAKSITGVTLTVDAGNTA